MPASGQPTSRRLKASDLSDIAQEARVRLGIAQEDAVLTVQGFEQVERRFADHRREISIPRR
jgi:hypothetical protein